MEGIRATPISYRDPKTARLVNCRNSNKNWNVASLDHFSPEKMASRDPTVPTVAHPVVIGVNDTPVFLLNEYVVELNPANFNILNQILN